MAKIKGNIVIDIEKCKGCELCIVSCPSKVIDTTGKLNEKGYNYVYPAKHEQCTGCANCAIVCPDGVITVYKAKI